MLRDLLDFVRYYVTAALNLLMRSTIIYRLKSKKYKPCETARIWKLESIQETGRERDETIDIFNCHVPKENIQWHKDYSSGYEYPVLRYDKLKFAQLYNKGIDVIFPWEVSRFHWIIALGQNYRSTGDISYYQRFRETILDWMEQNPFLYGVNWVNPMTNAIRASNWIIACELFDDQVQNDPTFKEKITISLQQHADFVLKFRHRGRGGNNHAVAQYAGLLFMSEFLKNRKSKRIRKIALGGLERNMLLQVFDDGVDGEFSTCYHRLVLELFAYPAILARANGICFTERFYLSLFKMFEFAASYMDHKGLVPQIGDNDSGRFLTFHDSDENDHSYLLNLGMHIFNYDFPSLAKSNTAELGSWFPDIQKVDPPKETRATDKSIGFPEGGFYFLKNENIYVSIIGNIVSGNSLLGHKHFDFGSFTLSHKGIPVIVDSGTYIYTPNEKLRNELKGLGSHNVAFPEDLDPKMYKSPVYFGIGKKWPIISDVSFGMKDISFKISYDKHTIHRRIAIEDHSVLIRDTGTSFIRSHIHTNLNLSVDQNTIISDQVRIESNTLDIKVLDTNYSLRYGHISNACSKVVFTHMEEIVLRIYFPGYTSD
jgi:hypothetical protein